MKLFLAYETISVVILMCTAAFSMCTDTISVNILRLFMCLCLEFLMSFACCEKDINKYNVYCFKIKKFVCFNYLTQNAEREVYADAIHTNTSAMHSFIQF